MSMDGVLEQIGAKIAEELIELAPGEISLDLLRRVYRSTQQPMSLRMRAAIEALPFEVPKLGVTANVVVDGSFAERLERALERSQSQPMLNGPKTIEHELVTSSDLKKPFPRAHRRFTSPR
jgi:hypothetical protein